MKARTLACLMLSALLGDATAQTYTFTPLASWTYATDWGGGGPAVTVDHQGNVFVASFSDFTIRKIDPTGVVTIVAGLPGRSGLVNGPVAAAQFLGPVGIAVDAGGTLFVANFDRIRTISLAGIVATLAGGAAWTAPEPPPVSPIRMAWPPIAAATCMSPILTITRSARSRRPES